MNIEEQWEKFRREAKYVVMPGSSGIKVKTIAVDFAKYCFSNIGLAPMEKGYGGKG